MKNWFELPAPAQWFVYGLVSEKSSIAFIGKPKAGKSTVIRNLIAAVIKNKRFMDRHVAVPKDQGKVLYLHLDAKDNPVKARNELQSLGLTEGDFDRVILVLPEHLPLAPNTDATNKQRIDWLVGLLNKEKPHLVVIDLLWKFLLVPDTNNYALCDKWIDSLQRAVTNAGGPVLAVALHARKPQNEENPFDDVIGSTAQRGSFATALMLRAYKKDGISVNTIQSDQTDRAEGVGEIPETIVEMDENCNLTLVETYAASQVDAKKEVTEAALQKLLVYVSAHPGCNLNELVDSLHFSKNKVIALLKESSELVKFTGTGVKGDPHRYYMNGMVPVEHQTMALNDTVGVCDVVI